MFLYEQIIYLARLPVAVRENAVRNGTRTDLTEKKQYSSIDAAVRDKSFI